MSIRFTYDWSSWPFNEFDDDGNETVEALLSPELKREVEAWTHQMECQFDVMTGFPNSEVRDELNREYVRLSQRLKDEGIDNYMDPWWNHDD